MNEIKPRIVKCPYCKKDSVFSPENAFRPFCSERCRLMDLGAWADESYKVPDKNSASYQDEGFLNEDDQSENE